MSKRKTITVFGKKYREVDRTEESYFRYFEGSGVELREYPYNGPLYGRIGWYAKLSDGRFNACTPSEKPIGAIEALEDRIKYEIEHLSKALASLREEEESEE